MLDTHVLMHDFQGSLTLKHKSPHNTYLSVSKVQGKPEYLVSFSQSVKWTFALHLEALYLNRHLEGEKYMKHITWKCEESTKK